MYNKIVAHFTDNMGTEITGIVEQISNSTASILVKEYGWVDMALITDVEISQGLTLSQISERRSVVKRAKKH